MALRASLVLSGDASGANAAVDSLDRNMDAAEAEAEKLAAAYGQIDRAIAALGRAQAQAAQETARIKAEFAAGAISLEQYNTRLLETKTALNLVSSQHASAVGALKQAQGALSAAGVSAGQAKAGYINLGRQMQDVAVQMQGGANIGTIIAQQGGQVADAVAMMGGRFAGFAEFLAGPWGAAIIVGIGVLANLAESMWTAGEAAHAQEDASKDLAKAIDQIVSATERQMRSTEASIKLEIDDANAKRTAAQEALRAANAQWQLAKARSAAAAASISPGAPSYSNTFNLGEQAKQDAIARGAAAEMARNQAEIGRLDGAIRLKRGSLLQREVAAQFDASAAATLKYDRALDRLNARLEAGKISEAQYRDAIVSATAARDKEVEAAKKSREHHGAKGTSAAQLADFGDTVASKIANIRDQFLDIPSEVKKSNQALRQLDDILADVGRRKGLDPAVAAKFRAEIEATKTAIENSLSKPFNDYIEKAQQAEQLDQLLTAGKADEAEALQVVIGLEKQQQPLSAEQLAKVLETVRAERERAKVLRDQQAIIQAQVQAVGNLRSALEQSVSGLLSGKGLSIGSIFQQIRTSVTEVASKRIVESLFGDALRGLEAKASALDPVAKSGQNMAAELDKAGAAIRDFADIVAQSRNVATGNSAATSGTAAVSSVGSIVAGHRDDKGHALEAVDPNAITVTAPKAAFAQMLRQLDIAGQFAREMSHAVTDPITAKLDEKLGTQFFSMLGSALAGAVSGFMTAGPAGGVIGALKETKGVPEALDKAFGKHGVLDEALKGAQTGTVVSGIANAIGIKMNSTGAQIGGAIGSFLPIPGGQIIGSIAGGLIGNLFGKKPRGSGSVTDTSIAASANDSGIKDGITSFGSSLQSAIGKIASELGATVGHYDIGLGRYKGYYQVSSSANDPYLGQTYYNQKSPNALYDGTDATAAFSAAVAGAIADGAIKGVSAKVAAALKSTNDIDKAIAEALKVQNLELALGGVSAALEKEFRTFSATAEERLRIARQYGFDVVAVEKLNADERLKLQEKLLKDQVGSLQQLIDDMTSGSLFEGSAVDKRQALLNQISAAKAQADQGVEGAADKLASLLSDFNSASRDVYGTTGGFAADRSSILDAARDTIAKANARVTAAEAANTSDPALATTNAALDENNSQNAQMIAYLQSIGVNIAALANIRGSFSDLAGAAAIK